MQDVKEVADPVRREERHYTYRDYASWPEGERWELIDGVAYSMSPAPGANHQRISGEMQGSLLVWLKQHVGDCEVFDAPFDVLLPSDAAQEEDEVDTVVQPDVLVVCDPAKVTPRGCRGAPDLVVEILSPWTSHKDQLIKHELYARHGVREFWVVDPGNRCARIYRLDAEASPRRFGEPVIVAENGRLESSVLSGFAIGLDELFARVR
jgi:Uma2 family endonuclease